MSMIGSSKTPFLHACGPPGDYILTVLDAGNDGLCCEAGDGFFLLMVGGETAAFGSDYGSLINIVFSIDADAMLMTDSITITPGAGGNRRLLQTQPDLERSRSEDKRSEVSGKLCNDSLDWILAIECDKACLVLFGVMPSGRCSRPLQVGRSMILRPLRSSETSAHGAKGQWRRGCTASTKSASSRSTMSKVGLMGFVEKRTLPLCLCLCV